MPNRINVVVIERESVYRRGLIAILESADDLVLSGSANDLASATTLLDEMSPNVALVGTTIADAPGMQLATEIRQQFPAVARVVITAQESDDELFEAIRAGAAAYCGMNVEEDELVSIVRRAAAGEYVINEQLLEKPYVASRIIDQFRHNTGEGDEELAKQYMPLTRRELEILGKVSDGMTNQQIGEDLGISVQTVKNHVTSILRKLAVNDRTHAVVTAIKRGWLKIEMDSDAM